MTDDERPDDGKTSTRKLCEHIVNSMDRIAEDRREHGPLVLIENSARILTRLCRVVSERIVAGGVTNDDLAPLRAHATPAAPSEPVASSLVDGVVGRDLCVDIAMDYVDNNIEHEEGCDSHGSDVMGDRFDCDCGVGRGLKELERLARLATHPAPRVTEAGVVSIAAAKVLLAFRDWPDYSSSFAKGDSKRVLDDIMAANRERKRALDGLTAALSAEAK